MRIAFKKYSNPIMFVGDNPALLGGLSRIGRDLACLASSMPEFRVAYLGLGLGQRRELPFITYDYPEEHAWGDRYLEGAWKDFAGDEPGIIMTLDDISRRKWMVNQNNSFLGPNRTFLKWMYTPIDSTGPWDGHLPIDLARTALQFDRVLAASKFGADALEQSGVKADWLPHGIFSDVFNPRGTKKPDKVIVGCVMANQARKDWACAFNIFNALLAQYGNRFRAWIHIDTLYRHWDIQALINDYGLANNLDVTVTLSDNELASYYRACACTILPSGGEGFGYPIAESMACGAPCVVTDYGAGPGTSGIETSVRPLGYRIEGPANCKRAISDPITMAKVVCHEIEKKLVKWEDRSNEIVSNVHHLAWDCLQYPWTRWFREGLNR